MRRPFREGAALRVTDIDAYRTCPRRFFIERVLWLSPSEIREFQMEPAELGSLIHAVMERLIKMPYADYTQFRANAGQALDEVFSGGLKSRSWTSPGAGILNEPFFKGLLKESFMGILPGIYEIEEELAAEGFTFLTAERDIEGEPVEGIKLKGGIDRINIRGYVTPEGGGESDGPPSDVRMSPGSSYEILDYKTGSAALSGSQVAGHGADLQLPLYAALLEERGMTVERVGIYSLGEVKISRLPSPRDKRTMDVYVTKAKEYLAETARAMRAAEFPASPLNPQTCRRCHERPYCPFIQCGGGSGGGGGQQ